MKNKLLVLISLILCFSMVFVLASCGGDTTSDTDTDTETEIESETDSEEEDESETETESEVESETETETETETESEGDESCAHEETEEVVEKELTCTQNGLIITKCKDCGEELKRDETSAKGHVPGEWEAGESSCTEDGEKVKYCQECGEELEREEQPATGHKWTEWGIGWDNEPYVKEATCAAQGYIGRICPSCGEEEVQYSDKLPHVYTWDITEGTTCQTGGTVKRGCENCNLSETLTIQAGEHLAVYVEGAKPATKEEDGSTGVTKCDACKTIIQGSKIIKIVNVALGGKVTSTSAFWALDQDYELNALVDGDRENGICSDPKVSSIAETIVFTEATNIYEVVLVVNGKGKTSDADNYSEITNNDYTISFVLCNEDGKVIFRSEEYSTKDKIELVVDVALPEGEVAKSIKITHSTSYKTDNCIWEVEAFSEIQYSYCEANGHDWIIKKSEEPVCETEKDGYEKKVCQICGEYKETILKFEHDWSEWKFDGFNCSIGGTKTKECKVCGKVESETVPAGDHLNVVLQNEKAPTLEENGYTGDRVCTACGETVEEGKAIPKLVNVALGSNVTTDSIFWASSSSGDLGKIVDGKKDTGLAGTTKAATQNDTITLAEAKEILQVILVVNGKGSTTDYKNPSEVTNIEYDISFILYDEAGKAIYTSETFNTKDQIEIVVDIELSEGELVKSMEITRVTSYSNEKYLWEVIMVAPGTAA